VLFLVDLSGSMEEKARWRPAEEGGRPPPKVTARKIDVARIELRRAIERLPADATFNVLTFESEVKRFANAPAEPTRERKLELWAWMDAWEHEGGTNTWLGLSTALDVAGVAKGRLEADTIYLITDGKPTLGEPAWIQRKVREKNEAGKVVIHVIQVGADDSRFCEDLAGENGGEFIQR
jgi:Mg-chelatase subunit ChlD